MTITFLFECILIWFSYVGKRIHNFITSSYMIFPLQSSPMPNMDWSWCYSTIRAFIRFHCSSISILARYSPMELIHNLQSTFFFISIYKRICMGIRLLVLKYIWDSWRGLTWRVRVVILDVPPLRRCFGTFG